MLRGAGVLLMLAAAVVSALGCGTPGVVEVQRLPGTANQGIAEAPDASTDENAGGEAGQRNEDERPAACPDGWSCMDIAALGYEATDADGDAVTASCSMGGIMPCDEDDPAGSCAGLTDPLCVYLDLGGQEIVSCGQRCTP